MIEVSNLNEKERLTALPPEIQETIQGILKVLDTTFVETGGTKELPLATPMESELTMQKSIYYQKLKK